MVDGRDSRDISVAGHLTQLAFAVQQQGRFEEAIELLEELLRWIKPGKDRDWAKKTIDECVAGRKE